MAWWYTKGTTYERDGSSPAFSEEALVLALLVNQARESTFPEFLEVAWSAGVVTYKVDFALHTVVYRGARGEEYTESYPAVSFTGLVFE